MFCYTEDIDAQFWKKNFHIPPTFRINAFVSIVDLFHFLLTVSIAKCVLFHRREQEKVNGHRTYHTGDFMEMSRYFATCYVSFRYV